MGMPLAEVEKMLESDVHEMRVGAVSIMDFQARSKKTTSERRKELFDLYIRRHDRINTWDLVDRSASYVVGGYLFDKPRKILYKLARSKKMPERRTEIVSTGYFIRQGEVEDTFRVAEILVDDEHDLIHKATGWMLRAAGDVDEQRCGRCDRERDRVGLRRGWRNGHDYGGERGCYRNGELDGAHRTDVLAHAADVWH